MWQRTLFGADMVNPTDAAHLATLVTAACAFLRVARMVGPDTTMTMSSAYTKIWTPFGRSSKTPFIKMRNNVTEITDPCGTPVSSLKDSDLLSPIMTLKVRSVKKFLMNWRMLPARPQRTSLRRIKGVQVLLNAFEISKEMISVWWPKFLAFCRASLGQQNTCWFRTLI